MSNTVRDVRCPDGHYECSVFYNTDDGPPPCVEFLGTPGFEPTIFTTCGKPRTAFSAPTGLVR